MVGRALPTRSAICFVRQAELIPELAIGAGRFECVEIGALEVLHEGQLQLVAIVRLADHDGDPLEAGQLRRPKTPLAGDRADTRRASRSR